MKRLTATLQFSELLLTLLRGNTGLVDALHVLAREGVATQIRESALTLLVMMKKGKGLSESLRSMESGKVFFDPLYLTLIAAAELTGNIESVLERIVMDLQRKRKAKETVVNVLIYPSIVILLAIFGTVMIMVKGIPVFMSSGLLSEEVVVRARSGVFIAGSVLLLGGGILFSGYFRIFYSDSPEFRIFYMLDFLLKSNVPLVEALTHCIVSIGHTKYGSALVAIKNDIVSGVAFSEAFARIRYFSPYVVGWLSVADMHGNIGEVCAAVKEYYKEKDTKLREIASRLLEPSVIVLTGIYILIIMVTVVLPTLTFAGGAL